MKKLLFIILLTLTSITFAQKISTLTLQKDSTKTDSVLVPGGMTPTAVFMGDSSKTPTMAYFEVSFGTNPTRRWYRVTSIEDTAAYSISDSTSYQIRLTDSTFIPLNSMSFNPVVGLYDGETPQVWIRMVVTTAQTAIKQIFIRFNPFK